MASRTKPGLGFLIVWSMVTAVGLLGAALCGFFSEAVVSFFIKMPHGLSLLSSNNASVSSDDGSLALQLLITVVVGACMGLVLGIGQRLAWSDWSQRIRGWIPLTMLGMAIVFTASKFINLGVNPLYGLLFGVVVGSAQSFALRSQGRLAVYWILVNAVAWAIAFVMPVAFPNVWLFIFLLGTPGLIIGLLSGLLLLWFLRRSQQVADLPV